MTSTPEKTFHCDDAATLVCEERDRSLLASENLQLREHLAFCHACSIAARQFSALFSQLDELTAVTMFIDRDS